MDTNTCQPLTWRSSQERLIVERFLLGQQYDSEDVHAIARASRLISTESDETLYRYCGAALHRMMKLLRETLQQKKGRGKVSSELRGIMELELDLLPDLTLKDKSSPQHSLMNLDEGNLIFPRI